MRILLTNDDGVNATGLKVLERIAREFSDDIWIVAPTEEQSGAGHSLTLTVPVRLRRLGERRFCVTGTPTDAVMMAIAWIMKDSPPDLILSGVNRGANLGEDVTYSGTVSAAMEGALAGIPFAHKDALTVRSHYDQMTVMLADAPLPDEIAIICCYANRGRLNERLGGHRVEDIIGKDGLR